MEKINIELAGIPLELTLRYKMFRDRYADFLMNFMNFMNYAIIMVLYVTD